jgi:hypothetical protein
VTEAAAAWWGRFDVPFGKAGRWQVGPLDLLFQRAWGEWQLAHQGGDDVQSLTSSFALVDEKPLAELQGVRRAVLSGGATGVELMPATADRAVVTQPEKPIEIMPRDEAVLYVGSPIWVQVSSVEPRQRLFDLPIQRPSDTWFGPPTNHGELCYANRVHCRLRLEDVPFRPHRALTRITVTNDTEERLVIERIKLPVVHLQLYASAGRLWTEDVVLRRAAHFGGVDAEFVDGPPRHASDAVPVGERRAKSHPSAMMRKLESLFS